ncbi:MAG: hypothetical protein KDE57_04235 [Calditrichaeota bacterium]|nr:hypothetical protein [Calditrichota bacterium]MCB0285841.1 hypothetical protein [Calditrichota bacterium]
MKSKLNLTIDENLVPLTKAFAKKHGKSVSELVEILLREVVVADEPGFSEKWRGKLVIDPKNEPRFDALKDRYQL